MIKEAHAQFRLSSIRQTTVGYGLSGDKPALEVLLVPSAEHSSGHLEMLIADSSPLATLLRTATIEQEYSVIFVPVQKENE